MSHYKINVDVTKKSVKLNKAVPSSTSRIINGQLITKDTENIKKNLQRKLALPLGDGNDLDNEVKIKRWHNHTLDTFETLLLQLDALLMNLRSKEKHKGSQSSSVICGYHDICEKLRLEVLIAIDKLGLVSSTREIQTGKDIDFMKTMCDLKRKLSEIRWQYHNAVKKLEMKVL